MKHEKPTVFFSHSSNDRDVITKLKEKFEQRTGGSVDVFLSSDGQSIPFGTNWVHKIEDALSSAKIMFVFVTPNSLRSNWIFFESGFTYSRGIKVVPVGLLGIDIGTLRPPMSLLQGFNVTSEEGLDNLIVIVNDEFKHKHQVGFTDGDFTEIVGTDSVRSAEALGQYWQNIEEIRIVATWDRSSAPSGAEVKQEIHQTLLDNKCDLKADQKSIFCHGATVSAIDGKDNFGLKITIDPLIVSASQELCNVCFSSLPENTALISHVAVFHLNVDFVSARQNLTARLFGTNVRFGKEDSMIWNDLSFKIGRFSSIGFNPRSLDPSNAYLASHCNNKVLDWANIGSLIDLLFERGVLFIHE